MEILVVSQIFVSTGHAQLTKPTKSVILLYKTELWKCRAIISFSPTRQRKDSRPLRSLPSSQRWQLKSLLFIRKRSRTPLEMSSSSIIMASQFYGKPIKYTLKYFYKQTIFAREHYFFLIQKRINHYRKKPLMDDSVTASAAE